MVVSLYPHQQKAVDQLGNGKILWGGVGTGKTITSIAYFYSKVCKGVYGDPGSLRTPRDLYIITTAKKRDSRDWESDAILFGITKDPETSVAGIRMVVDSWNNIGKYTDVKDAFFIFDEQRLVGSGTWTKSFIKIAKTNEWILLSATPGDTWLDYIPVFVANGFYKNRTEFKREHVVYNTYSKFPKVDRYIGVGKMNKHRRDLLVHMPYERHTTRRNTDCLVSYDKELFDRVVKDRWHVYEERPLRDVAELFNVMRKVVNSDVSRLEALTSLMEVHPRLIVFYNFDYELEMLRSLRPSDLTPSTTSSSPQCEPKTKKTLDPARAQTATSASLRGATERCAENCEGHWTEDRGDGETFLTCEKWNRAVSHHAEVLQKTSVDLPNVDSTDARFAVAEWNGHKHEEVPKTERWLYLVQYTAGSEGWNCITTDAMCFYSLTYSYKAFHQAHGRIDRLNTPYTELDYYTLVSNSLIDKAILKSLRSKKSFNERNLAI